MALKIGDLGKERESSLADGYLYRLGQFVLVDPLLKSLHNGPRFAALLKKLKLPQTLCFRETRVLQKTVKTDEKLCRAL